MGRTARDRRDAPHPRPIRKVELSEENMKRRFFLMLLFLGIGIAFIVRALLSYLSADSGWQEISASSSELNCSEEFVFLYELGSGDQSATAENKALVILYSDACEKAYLLFSTDTEAEDFGNLYTLNANPNEVIEVDETLYEALALVAESGDRSIYLGPAYAYYDDIFYCTDDSQTYEFDPYQNAEIAAYYAEIAAFAQDESAVNIELLGDNQVCLSVSADYLAYAEENGITVFVDFFWMKNAFIIDYLADVLTQNGYTNGCISSYDGFARNLDERGTEFSFAVYSLDGMDILQPAIMQYTSRRSIVYYRSYMMSDQDLIHYYEMSDGEILTSYLDIADGLPKTARDDLIVYSDSAGCAEILLASRAVYVSDSWDETAALALSENEMYVIYTEDGVVYYNDAALVLDADGASVLAE